MFVPIPIFSCILSIFPTSGNSNTSPKHSPPNSSSEIDLGENADSFSEKRQQMVLKQIKSRGISNQTVLKAMSKVPRHCFVPNSFNDLAYNDCPLPIDYRQTISQPYIVAYMTEMANIKPEDKVLEIGTGSGYQSAVLGELAQEVYSIEIIAELSQRASQTLQQLGYDNIHLRIGDGYQGWPEKATYQSIIVTAAPEQIPPTLIDQLALNGKMVIPVGKHRLQIIIITKTEDGITEEATIPVRFVPMVTKLIEPP